MQELNRLEGQDQHFVKVVTAKKFLCQECKSKTGTILYASYKMLITQIIGVQAQQFQSKIIRYSYK